MERINSTVVKWLWSNNNLFKNNHRLARDVNEAYVVIRFVRPVNPFTRVDNFIFRLPDHANFRTHLTTSHLLRRHPEGRGSTTGAVMTVFGGFSSRPTTLVSTGGGGD